MRTGIVSLAVTSALLSGGAVAAAPAASAVGGNAKYSGDATYLWFYVKVKSGAHTGQRGWVRDDLLVWPVGPAGDREC